MEWFDKVLGREEESASTESIAALNQALDRLEALLDRVDKEDADYAGELQQEVVRLTSQVDILGQQQKDWEQRNGMSALATAEYICIVCKQPLVIYKDTVYIAAMCPNRVYNPKQYADHTSIQFDGRSWYNADNVAFLPHMRKQMLNKSVSFGTSYSYSQFTSTGFDPRRKDAY